MLKILSRAPAGSAANRLLTLTFDDRRKSRQRVRLDDGVEAALMLDRGTVLAEGDRLLCEDGSVVGVGAAPESLSSIESDDALALARAAYHLGNRHVPVEVRPGRLRYQHDHVLDDMVRGLGLSVRAVMAPFHPEPGAYGGGHHAHDHHDHQHHHHG